jgi:hypothetical protein
VRLIRNELPSTCKLKLRNAFLDRTARDAKDVFSVGLSEASVPFANIGSN